MALGAFGLKMHFHFFIFHFHNSLLFAVRMHRDFSPSIESDDSLRVLVSIVLGKYSILSVIGVVLFWDLSPSNESGDSLRVLVSIVMIEIDFG